MGFLEGELRMESAASAATTTAAVSNGSTARLQLPSSCATGGPGPGEPEWTPLSSPPIHWQLEVEDERPGRVAAVPAAPVARVGRGPTRICI